MMPVTHAMTPVQHAAAVPRAGGASRAIVVGLMAFLTVADLFATQAILPALTVAYDTSPARMSLAVNASTLGMAIAGLAMSLIGDRIPRRNGILVCLLALAVPTTLLAGMPDLATFAGLRILQGLCMAAAFTLTLAHLGEDASQRMTATAFAAYITGNVASNLFGRFLSAAVADHFGLALNFYAFAALNLCGAALVYATVPHRASPRRHEAPPASLFAPWAIHLRNPALRSAFALGFCILFAFIGTFTYVNFLLVSQPFGLGMMELGFVYVVFLPSILTTPFAGRLVSRWGVPVTCGSALAFAGLGIPLLLLPSLAAVLAGLVLVSVGTFFAQAVATGFVGRAVRTGRAAASGLYLASYFSGGVIGSLALGWLYDGYGWGACVAGVALALAVAGVLARRLQTQG
ncbi:MAG: MFS transporter [Acetobacteraceae bacterium]